MLSFDNYNNTISLPSVLFLQFLDGDYLDNKVVQINKLNLNNYNVRKNPENNAIEL